MARIVKLMSGGETGVERAVLFFAADHDIPYGGYTPKHGRAEDYRFAPGVRGIYPQLEEAASIDPACRIPLNVEHSDATLVIAPRGMSSPLLTLAASAAHEFGRPIFITDGGYLPPVLSWLDSLGEAVTLNIVGPPKSQASAGYARTYSLLEGVLTAEL